MLPYWIELSAGDLMQGTAVLGMAITLLSLRLLVPTGRV